MTHGGLDPLKLLQPRREITGISAVLLPYAGGAIDWSSFRALLSRTVEAGLMPAVNMDTGDVNLLTANERAAVLDATRETLAGQPFVAGAFVDDEAGASFDIDAYAIAMAAIEAAGATPVIFPSHGLTGRDEFGVIDAHRQLATRCDHFIAFELGQMFAASGRTFSFKEYLAVMAIPNCIGIKHSSLSRGLEWLRLKFRAENRPDFKIFTGNDLAIDMVMYGSDYLLGLSAFAPDMFARRDRYWAEGSHHFYTLNDALQYLGSFAFRDPVPAYKHTAAQFLHLRGWIASSEPHPQSASRPDSDVDILRPLLVRLENLVT